jgi:hypothetical protein
LDPVEIKETGRENEATKNTAQLALCGRRRRGGNAKVAPHISSASPIQRLAEQPQRRGRRKGEEEEEAPYTKT